MEKSGNSGYTKALTLLGKIYCDGNGVLVNHQKSMKSYEKAAEMGDSDVILILGTFYLEGHGVPQDNEKAYAYFQRSVALGNPIAHLFIKDKSPFPNTKLGVPIMKAMK